MNCSVDGDVVRNWDRANPRTTHSTGAVRITWGHVSSPAALPMSEANRAASRRARKSARTKVVAASRAAGRPYDTA